MTGNNGNEFWFSYDWEKNSSYSLYTIWLWNMVSFIKDRIQAKSIKNRILRRIIGLKIRMGSVEGSTKRRYNLNENTDGSRNHANHARWLNFFSYKSWTDLFSVAVHSNLLVSLLNVKPYPINCSLFSLSISYKINILLRECPDGSLSQADEIRLNCLFSLSDLALWGLLCYQHKYRE